MGQRQSQALEEIKKSLPPHGVYSLFGMTDVKEVTKGVYVLHSCILNLWNNELCAMKKDKGD